MIFNLPVDRHKLKNPKTDAAKALHHYALSINFLATLKAMEIFLPSAPVLDAAVKHRSDVTLMEHKKDSMVRNSSVCMLSIFQETQAIERIELWLVLVMEIVHVSLSRSFS